jgi:hypothetical protein
VILKEPLSYLEGWIVKIKSYLQFMDPHEDNHVVDGRVEVYEHVLEQKGLNRSEAKLRLDE